VGVLTAIFNTLIILTSLFLICLILIQRGKGGGLAGAFGGVGGSSAFGTKAGDTFTKITVVTASVWILMAMLLVVMTNRRTASAWGTDAPTSQSKELGSSSSRGKAKPAEAEAGSTSPSSSPKPAEAPSSPSEPVPAIPDSAAPPATPGSTPKTP
jgi:preprotein translocase subunit SecG